VRGAYSLTPVGGGGLSYLDSLFGQGGNAGRGKETSMRKKLQVENKYGLLWRKDGSVLLVSWGRNVTS